ncbi:unnamed protein product [Gongylonema pulchrum]|uniref:Regulator of microtubule dynamics protein 2 n=1 Tax=Gongylonema pulchrum TaxID=637853 RepID=A0A183D0Z7_9BILA|nr:unnamed protein product [Gongylonema pulchrum]
MFLQDFVKIDKLMDDNAKRAYEELKKIYESSDEAKTDVELLWRLGKACFLWANTMPKKDSVRKRLIFEGRAYATAAYANDESNFEALRWLAILVGSCTDFMGPKEKIEQGKIFKMYLDRAIEAEPNEFTMLHSRGRFSYEVANLSWVERRLCNALFSQVPSATIEEALSDFLEAEKCAQFVWPENLLYIVRCYALKKDKKHATMYLEKAEEVEHPDEATREALTEVRCMVAKLK